MRTLSSEGKKILLKRSKYIPSLEKQFLFCPLIPEWLSGAQEVGRNESRPIPHYPTAGRGWGEG